MSVALHVIVLIAKNVAIGEWNPSPTEVSLTACAVSCMSHPDCFSFMYHHVQMRCAHGDYANRISMKNPGYQMMPGLYYYSKDKGAVCRGKGHTYSSVGDCCYSRSTEDKIWADAEQDCKNKGGSLFIIDDKEKHLHITKVLKNEANLYQSIIGAHKEPINNSWVWTNGKKIEHFYWHRGQPSGNSITMINMFPQDCLQYWLHNEEMLWDDCSCNIPIPYLCNLFS